MAPADGKALMILTLAEGNSLQTAATNTATQLELTTTSSKQITINGLQALEVMSKQVSQDPNTGAQSEITIQSVYIQYGKNIYVFMGYQHLLISRHISLHLTRPCMALRS